MPFLIRIVAQRVVLLVLSSMTILGLGPETNLGTTATTTENEQVEQPSFLSIPIPEINILNLPIANKTKIEDIKTSIPIIPEIPIKTPVIRVTEKKVEETTPTQSTPIKSPATQQTPTQSTPIDRTPVTQPVVEKPPETISETKPETKIATEVIPDTSSINSIENIVVNILCIRQVGNRTSLTNGSGVIISSSGIVLTNAHVAQHFLLKDQGYNCSIRRENIPLYGFNAVPLYISEKWIENNFSQIKSSAPTGTGKYDYALLLITGNTNPTASLPKFPSTKFNTATKFLDTGDTVTIAGYPAQMTSSLEVAKNNALQTERVRIREIFTLETSSVDVVSTTDSVVAQRGASGGGVFKNDELGGIVVSTKNGNDPMKLSANVLTLSYINRELKNETGKTISEIISGNVIKQAEDFVTVGQRLTQLLMKSF